MTMVRLRLTALSLAVAVLVPLAARAATSTTTAATGLPLYQYTQTNSGPLPWDASAVAAIPAGVLVVGTPRVATAASGSALSLRTASGAVAIVTPDGGYLDVSSQLSGAPTPANDPVAYQAPDGTWSTWWTTSDNHLIWATQLSTENLPALNAGPLPDSVWTWRDLSANGPLATGTPATQGTVVATRTPDGRLDYWQLGAFTDAPTVSDLSTATSVLAGCDPLLWSGTLSSWPVVVTCSSAKHVVVVSHANSWSVSDATIASASSPVASGVSLATTSSGFAVAGLTSSGAVLVLRATVAGTTSSWTAENLSILSNAPALTGTPSVTVNADAVFVSAAALNWGDLFTLTAATPTSVVKAQDVSATGGSLAKTVGGGVASALTAAGVTLYAGGVATPAKVGTGLYAAPSGQWARAIADGWPILSVTGGLGTTASPWVQSVPSSKVSQTADFQLGATIAASHLRVTWLSFWTVSGPTASEGAHASSATYYNHAYAAGVAVANQIDAYRAAGLGLKPDWVIIDPEGYPDLHSCMDGTGTGATWCAPSNATTWAAYVNGWAAGLAAVDASLRPGVYASQSEIKNGALGTLNVPLFVATAFSAGVIVSAVATSAGASSIAVQLPAGGPSANLVAGEKIIIGKGATTQVNAVASTYVSGSLTVPLVTPLTAAVAAGTHVQGFAPPVRFATTVGPNLLGYIAFNSGNNCALENYQRGFFSQASWGGLYNTLQFEPSTYCPPL